MTVHLVKTCRVVFVAQMVLRQQSATAHGAQHGDAMFASQSQSQNHPILVQENCMAYRRLADMPWLGRALGGRGEPFETPFAGGVAGGIEGREALRRWRVFIGNFVLTEACVNAARQRGDFCKRQTCTSSTREQGNKILADSTQQ